MAQAGFSFSFIDLMARSFYESKIELFFCKVLFVLAETLSAQKTFIDALNYFGGPILMRKIHDVLSIIISKILVILLFVDLISIR